MSFYTSLTGLNGAQADIAAISNNVANVGTTGFKLSRAQFGDIFATSPLQNASGAVGSGTILKKVQQQFTQGNISSSQNSLDMAISGQGFFALKPSLTSTQTVYTRNGNFSVNNNRYVVDTQGQYLQVFPVNSDGSVIATGIQSAKNLQLPSTSGLPNATASIQLGLNLPADASIIPSSATYTKDNPYKFDRTNASTYNQSTSITIYDSLGNPTIATIYYVKTLNATSAIPNNRWQTHVFVGDKEVDPSLITSKDDQSRTLYINKYGQTTTDPTSFDSSFVANQPSPLFYQDDQIIKAQSTPAQVLGSIQNTSGFDFGDTDANQVTITTDPSQYSLTREGGNTALNSPFWGKDMFSISVDGSATQSITIKAGSYTGDELAAEMTRAVNSKFSDSKYFRITDTYRDVGGSVIAGNDVFNVSLSKIATDGSTVTLEPPLEIDLLGTNGGAGTPQDALVAQQLNYQDLTRDQMINLAQTKVNEALNARHNEFGKNPNWVDEANPPIKVGFDVASRSLTFTADPGQLGPDASLPQNRFQTLQVYNSTNSLNDLGLPSLTSSPSSIIGTNSRWSGQAVLPSGPPITAAGDQRTGVTVSYNKDTRQFVFSSGSTGETSSIKVGRASLAQVADILPQINSYDLSNVKLDKNESIVLELDGRSFTYTTPVAVDYNVPYPAAAGASAISADDFINNLQEAFPVSFAQTTQSNIGTATQKETQVITPFGNLLNGDKFNLTIQLDKDPAPSVSLSVGPLSGFSSDTKTSDRVTTLSNSIQDAIDTAAMNASVEGPTCSVVSGQIVMVYPTVGSISTIASMKQTVRGLSDTKTTTAAAESAVVTFNGLNAGQSLTLGGLKLTATLSMTNEEVANAFASLSSGVTSGSTSKGTFTGSLIGWNSASVTTTPVSAASTANNTFSAGVSGTPITKSGLTFTPNKDLTAAQVAAAFANLTSGAITGPSTADGTYSGALTAGISTGAVAASTTTNTFSAGVSGTPITKSGLTFTPNTAMTAAQVAAAFANLASGATTGPATTGAYSGALTTGFSTGAVTNTVVASPATNTFSAGVSGIPITKSGLTFTPNAAMTAAQVAAAFANLASGATTGPATTGTYSGALTTGVSTGAVTNTQDVVFTTAGASDVVFTNTNTSDVAFNTAATVVAKVALTSVLSKNVTDLGLSSTGTLPTVVTTQGVTDTTNNYTYFTDQTVTSSPAIVSTSGNAKTYEIQSLILQPQSIGGSVVIVPGDQYIITVPKSDGSVSTETITVPPLSPAIAPATLAATTGLEALVMKLNKQTNGDNDSFGNTVQFSVDKDNPNKLVMTYKALGSIVGTFSIKQFARVDSSISGSVATQIRPEAIGPLSLALAPGNGHRLMVEGNPNGEPFRLNVQAGGVVQPAEAEGATGSKTQTGRQIGQSLASNTNSGAIFAGNNDLLGIGATKSETSVAGTGLASTAATAYGSAAITPMNQTFLLNESLGENKMTFTVDGITGTITLPIRAYTGDTFATAIQQRVNLIQDPVTGRVVSGVTVKFDPNNNRLVFTSGTTGSTSQINVVGKANFGLNSVTQTAGKVPTITNLVQATDTNGNKLYVDSSGNITTVVPTTKLQSWSPLYLTPGELTFDTAGKLISPKQGVVYSPFDPGNGSNPLNLTIDYGKFSTQYTQPFSVQSLTQDGYPSGSLNGLTIDASGTVIANYTNGQTNALGKVMIANFANPNGLKQIGNADYVATSVSGDATLGQAGSDGLGSIQAGALENSNVDITEELVKLITAQRNFQANSKAIETETSLTQTIIQIRA